VRVHVVGNACVDTVFRVPWFPAPGETLNAFSHADSVGGKGANQAVAAARTGAAVTLWTALGNDEHGDWIATALARELSLEALRREGPSDRSAIMVRDDGENAIVSGVSRIEAYRPAEQTALPNEIAAGDFLLVQGNMTEKATRACLDLARRAEARSAMNISPVGPSGRWPDLGGIGLAVLNGDEAIELTGAPDHPAAIESLARTIGGDVVVTLGPDGCLVMTRGATVPVHFPAQRVHAIDTSGAGDVFCGSLVGFLAQGHGLVPAARLAGAAAAISVTRMGTLPSCPTADEMRELVKQMEEA